jgi:UDP-2-acetamido-3-amino-2,3-dideoxy-glucuronate N-acetyltransferase
MAGKDVLVEKPMALKLAQGEELVRLAEANSRVLMVGHVLEYHPAVVKLKELINQGQLGNVNYIYSQRLNLGKFRREENILWSFAPHDISVILLLLDEMPEEVAARAGSYLQKELCQRCQRPYLCELAPPVQGAEVGGGGGAADGPV